MTEQYAEQLAQMSEAEICTRLGAEIFSAPSLVSCFREIPEGETPEATLIRVAVEWVKGPMKRAICGRPELQTIAKPDVVTADRVLAVAAVLEAVAHTAHVMPFPAITTAALVLRVGLHSICADKWEPPPIESKAD